MDRLLAVELIQIQILIPLHNAASFNEDELAHNCDSLYNFRRSDNLQAQLRGHKRIETQPCYHRVLANNPLMLQSHPLPPIDSSPVANSILRSVPSACPVAFFTISDHIRPRFLGFLKRIPRPYTPSRQCAQAPESRVTRTLGKWPTCRNKIIHF